MASAESKDENGFPKPDFSEMEKYFDIVKYEYDRIRQRLNFVSKMKKENNTEFYEEIFTES